MRTEWAPSVYRRLHGIFCVYKPADMSIKNMIAAIQFNLAKDLNALPCYKAERKQTTIKADTNIILPATTVKPVGLTDLSDHRLVLGPRYIQSDFRIKFVSGLGRHSSGVQVLGIGYGTKTLKILDDSKFLRVYQIRGKFGMATDDFSCRGRLLQKSTYHHITKAKVDKACSAIEAQHQRHLFMHAQIDSQSQEAYELASQGLIRPMENSSVPILYGVRCIDFNLPEFTLEVHSLNENMSYLMLLLHDLGIVLKSTAMCTQIRRIRHGHFELEHVLLRKFWTLENILDNIRVCKKLTTADKLVTPELLVDQTDSEELKQLTPS